MEQINEGSVEEVSIETRDVCILCDYLPNVTIRPSDACSCCDATDWNDKDE